MEEIKRRIREERDFAIHESKNEKNSDDIKTAYDYKRDAFETALWIIDVEKGEKEERKRMDEEEKRRFLCMCGALESSRKGFQAVSVTKYTIEQLDAIMEIVRDLEQVEEKADRILRDLEL